MYDYTEKVFCFSLDTCKRQRQVVNLVVDDTACPANPFASSASDPVPTDHITTSRFPKISFMAVLNGIKTSNVIQKTIKDPVPN